MFKLDNLDLIRTFKTGNPVVRYPKHAAFAEESARLVTGTDRGCAIIYDTLNGNTVQTLDYPPGGLVQHVAVAKSLPANRYTVLTQSPSGFYP